MNTSEILLEQREKIQDDLTCILDGADNEVINNCCQVIVERFQILFDKLITK